MAHDPSSVRDLFPGCCDNFIKYSQPFFERTAVTSRAAKKLYLYKAPLLVRHLGESLVSSGHVIFQRVLDIPETDLLEALFEVSPS